MGVFRQSAQAKGTITAAATMARRLGVTRDQVRELASEPGFPTPVDHVASAPLWPWTRVQAWTRERASRIAA